MRICRASQRTRIRWHTVACSMPAITHAPHHHRLVSSSDDRNVVVVAPAPATLSSNTTAPEVTPVEVVAPRTAATAAPPPLLQQLVPSAPAATTAARAAAESFPVSLCTTSLKLATSVLTSLVTMCFTFTCCCRWCVVGRLVGSAGAGSGGPHDAPPPPPSLGWPSIYMSGIVRLARLDLGSLARSLQQQLNSLSSVVMNIRIYICFIIIYR